MKEVMKNIFVGDIEDCKNVFNAVDANYAIVHACKTCHRLGVGYTGNLKNDHPEYLIKEDGIDLFLNMVDMDRELMALYTNPIMKAAFEFIDKYLKLEHKVLVHCDQGGSRGPSVAMLYISRYNQWPSYKYAVDYFKEIYPDFNPGRGIELYMQKNFDAIMKL